MPVCAATMGFALFRCLAADPACMPPAFLPFLPDIAAVSEQESSFNPWALRDETTGESLFLASRQVLAREIVARTSAGHILGIGMPQITGRANWQRHGLDTIERLTDPCLLMRAGAIHWTEDLKSAANQKYNSGRTNGAPAYAEQVATRRVRLAALLAAPVPAPAAPETPAAPPLRLPAFSRADGPRSAFERGQPHPQPSIEADGAGSPQRLADRN